MQRRYSSPITEKHVILAIWLVFCFYSGRVVAQERAYYGGGTGEPHDPYQIWTPEQFVAINAHSEDWGSSFRLMADVNLVAMDPDLIAPIGNHTVPFSGLLDGNDFAIENFVLHSDTLNDVGIFGVVSTQAIKDLIDPNGLGRNYIFEYGTHVFDAGEAVVHVKDLKVVNAGVRGKNNVGVLAARCYGSIQRCRVTNANVVNAGIEVGGADMIRGAFEVTDGVLTMLRLHGSLLSSAGLVGHLAVGNLVDCHVSSVKVDGIGMVGGLVGFAIDSSMTSSSAQGTISGGHWTGGLVGYVRGTQVTQCGTEVSMSSRWHVGGLIGKAAESDIAECRAIVNAMKGSDTGGFIGTSTSSTGGCIGSSVFSFITNCYSKCDPNALTPDSGGLIVDSSGDVLKFCYSVCYLKNTPSGGRGGGQDSLGGSFIRERVFSVSQTQPTEASFWDRDTSEIDIGVNYRDMRYTDMDLPYEEIYGKTTQEMWTRKTYTDAGWDFERIWTIEEGAGYPVLQWELASASNGQ